ncbi:hypothetical protein [Robertmurraya massiliosenegalensis]|uniref:hypothetical protein n=1 Tax=Robertmurraya massiliosenegalensis TaxID=1287657 RepID=UPI0002D77998|nr:hypothetical protein [Robertmurraya massiliosenegalensis]
MDKVMIIGTFEFLGFHFTKKLLEEGVEVLGIHHQMSDEASYLIEEKRLQIGRNANFEEKSIDALTRNTDDYEVVMVDYYDFFMRGYEDSLFHDENYQWLMKNSDKIVFLLPLSLRNDPFKENRVKLEKYISLLRSDKDVQEFLLPTIFGPWQTDVFLFQQALTKKKDEWNLSAREWTADALYVEDMVRKVLKLVDDDKERYLLRNDQINGWEECANYLNIKDVPVRDVRSDGEGIEVVVPLETSIETGIKNQQKLVHFQ